MKIKTRSIAVEHGFIPAVPPKKNRKEPWDYDKELYKKRNEVERFFFACKNTGEYSHVMKSSTSFI